MPLWLLRAVKWLKAGWGFVAALLLYLFVSGKVSSRSKKDKEREAELQRWREIAATERDKYEKRMAADRLARSMSESSAARKRRILEQSDRERAAASGGVRPAERTPLRRTRSDDGPES